MIIRVLLLLVAVCVALLVACGPVGSEPGATISPDDTPITPEPADERPSVEPTVSELTPLEPVLPGATPLIPATGEVPQELLDVVLADLQERTGVAIEGVEVVESLSVVWNDGSLGCPQPGMMYTQALEPGYQVRLVANGQEYDYHLSERGFFVLCENAPPRPGADGTVDR